MKLKLPEHETWRASALCAGEAPKYEAPDLTSGGRVSREMLMEYRRRADLCWECPVMLKCDASASPGDRWWTIIAGELPGVMDKTFQSIPKQIREALPPSETCRNGHPRSTTPQTHRGCEQCRAERVEREVTQRKLDRLKARQEAGLALTEAQIETGVCPSGHDIEGRSSLNRYGRCRQCASIAERERRRESERKRYHKTKARKEERRTEHLRGVVVEAFGVSLQNATSSGTSLVQHPDDMGALSA